MKRPKIKRSWPRNRMPQVRRHRTSKGQQPVQPGRKISDALAKGEYDHCERVVVGRAVLIYFSKNTLQKGRPQLGGVLLCVRVSIGRCYRGWWYLSI
jgi:hypothetical protein